MKKYNQDLKESDILEMFENKEVVSIFEICEKYNCSIYKAKQIISGMNLKVTNYGFRI